MKETVDNIQNLWYNRSRDVNTLYIPGAAPLCAAVPAAVIFFTQTPLTSGRNCAIIGLYYHR